MKNSILISMLILMGASAQAIRHVGNGGGVSEQNLVFAFENAGSLVESCELDCDLNVQEKSILRDFVASLQKPHGSLYFHQDNCSGFSVENNRWNICLPEILLNGRDRDLDGFLNLGESLLLLFRMDSSAKAVAPATIDSLEAKLFRTLSSQSVNFVFQLKKIDFHIFGYRDSVSERTPLFIQSRDAQKAVSLWPYLTEGLACTDFDLAHPYITDQFESENNQRVVLVFPLTLYCSGNASGTSKLKVLQLEFVKDQIRIY